MITCSYAHSLLSHWLTHFGILDNSFSVFPAYWVSSEDASAFKVICCRKIQLNSKVGFIGISLYWRLWVSVSMSGSKPHGQPLWQTGFVFHIIPQLWRCTWEMILKCCWREKVHSHAWYYTSFVFSSLIWLLEHTCTSLTNMKPLCGL